MRPSEPLTWLCLLISLRRASGPVQQYRKPLPTPDLARNIIKEDRRRPTEALQIQACTIRVSNTVPKLVSTTIMDDSWFRSQQSPRNEGTASSFVSPPRNGSRVSQPQAQTPQSDPRSHLPRRFTTDSSRGVPTLSTVAAGPDYNVSAFLGSLACPYICVAEGVFCLSVE